MWLLWTTNVRGFFFLEVAVGCQNIEKEQSFNAGCFSKSFASEETLFLVVPTTYQ